MKKLRMIVTSVIVLAIVGSAFAFKAKKAARFCFTDTINTACTVSSQNLKRVTGTPLGSFIRYYKTDWTGDQTECTNATCSTQATFVAD